MFTSFKGTTLRLLGALCERWSEMSALTKFKLTVVGVGFLIGLPTSAMGLVWYEMRIALQMSNCSDDLTKPMLDALLQADGDAVLRAASAQRLSSPGSVLLVRLGIPKERLPCCWMLVSQPSCDGLFANVCAVVPVGFRPREVN